MVYNTWGASITIFREKFDEKNLVTQNLRRDFAIMASCDVDILTDLFAGIDSDMDSVNFSEESKANSDEFGEDSSCSDVNVDNDGP